MAHNHVIAIFQFCFTANAQKIFTNKQSHAKISHDRNLFDNIFHTLNLHFKAHMLDHHQ